MLPVLSHFLVPRVISTTDEKFRLVCFCFRSALGGEQMEGLEFDVYASGPQTSLDLQGFRLGQAECLHSQRFLGK